MRLLSNRKATPSTRTIRLGLDGARFEYLPGQAAWLGVPHKCEPTPYSIASAPGETARDGWLEFLVKVDGSTRFGACVSDLRRGTEITVSGPAGAFVFPDETPFRNFLFVAGGTGIAPLRSMIYHAIEQPVPGRIALLYSAKTADEFAYLRDLRALARAGRIELSLTLTGETGHSRHARGRADAARLAPLVGDTPPLCFLCGPGAMVAALADALASLGVPRDNIRTEGW
jgi:ferredoxin-NADP reductase